jgi:hypothetical protein
MNSDQHPKRGRIVMTASSADEYSEAHDCEYFGNNRRLLRHLQDSHGIADPGDDLQQLHRDEHYGAHKDAHVGRR